MNIKYGFHPQRVESVSSFIDGSLTSNCYDGQFETLVRENESIKQALSNLCDILTDKGLLTADDIVKITGEYFEDHQLTFEGENNGNS